MSELRSIGGQGPASTRERRQAVLELLLEHSEVGVRDLAARFSVSAMTVHRDLDALEARGVLRKVRGGATLEPTGAYEGSVAFRMGEMREAKEAIARLAAEQVTPGSSIALDDSTTALAMLPHLADVHELTIVTTFAAVVDEVARMTDSSFTLIVVGGTYSAKYHSFGGPLAQQSLLDLRVDRCFLSVAAIDARRGAFHREPEQAAIKRTMVEIADRSTLLADASKFTKRGVHRILGLDAFDTAIVDDSTGPEIVEALRASGLELAIAATPTTRTAKTG